MMQRSDPLRARAIDARAAVLPWLPAFAIGLVGAWRALARGTGHDVAWLHHVASQALDGQRLYVDLLETNPPLVIWLAMPAVLLERVIHIRHTLIFPVLVAAAAVVSLVACSRLAARMMAEPQRWPFTAALAVALLALPWTEWGQREHLMLILCFPHLLSASIRLAGGAAPKPLATGVPAAIGYALKPHFALCFILVEAVVWWRTRRAWPEGLLITGLGMTYALAVVFTTNYVEMALAVQPIYAQFVPASPVLIALRALPFLLIAAVAARLPGEARDVRTVLAVASASWFVILVAQGKGFYYHYLPLYAGVVIIGTTALAGLRIRRAPAYAILAAVALGLVVTMESPTDDDDYWRGAHREAVHLMRGAGPVLILSTDIQHVWPAVTEAGASWSASVPAFWSLLTIGSVGRQYAVDHAVEALAKDPLVLVPNHAWTDALHRMSDEPAFREAWTGYERVGTGEFFRVYRRASPR